MKKCILFIILLYGIVSNATAQVQPTDTDGDGYINISNLDHLRWVSENSSSWENNFELDNNINAAATVDWNSQAGFSPIGSNFISFTGEFEGNGFAIDSLYINRPGTNNIGLFGMTRWAKISNIGITNCHIIGKDTVGGLVGGNRASIASNSYSTGKVSGNTYVGGLIGENYNSTVSKSYNTGSVSGQYYVGGLIGGNYNSMVCNSYNAGSISGSSNVGGLVGGNDRSIVINSFWDTQTSGQITSAGGIGKTTAEMKTILTFTNAGWNFNVGWAINPDFNSGYPYIYERILVNISGIEPIDTDGDGYRNISCYSHLHWISCNASSWTRNYELDNNINADTTWLLSGDNGFNPIGNATTKFWGKFKGNGFVIDSLYINRPEKDCIGLFGLVSGTEILNVGITNCQLIGGSYVGGLVGWNLSSTTVGNSYSTGKVYGNSQVGGLVGKNDFNTTVSNCYSTCNVSGNSMVGGLVGDNNNSTVSNSYSTSNVSGNSVVGGLVGDNFYSSTVSNSFWDKETSGISISDYGIGKTTAEMKTKLTFTSAGWDFDTTWSITADYNNGYPNLDGKKGTNGIKEIHSGSLIYPQPASNELFVRLSETSQELGLIKFYDQAGQLAFVQETSANDGLIRLNTSALASGVYRMIISINGKSYLEKVVVAK